MVENRRRDATHLRLGGKLPRSDGQSERVLRTTRDERASRVLDMARIVIALPKVKVVDARVGLIGLHWRGRADGVGLGLGLG